MYSMTDETLKFTTVQFSQSFNCKDFHVKV